MCTAAVAATTLVTPLMVVHTPSVIGVTIQVVREWRHAIPIPTVLIFVTPHRELPLFVRFRGTLVIVVAIVVVVVVVSVVIVIVVLFVIAVALVVRVAGFLVTNFCRSGFFRRKERSHVFVLRLGTNRLERWGEEGWGEL